MSRPLGIEFPGAFFHVIARDDRGEAICEDDGDRRLFVDGLGDVVDSFDRRYSACSMLDPTRFRPQRRPARP